MEWERPPWREAWPLSMPVLPDADTGIPKRGVSPSHVQGARIGIRASLAVAQPQSVQ